MFIEVRVMKWDHLGGQDQNAKTLGRNNAKRAPYYENLSCSSIVSEQEELRKVLSVHGHFPVSMSCYTWPLFPAHY